MEVVQKISPPIDFFRAFVTLKSAMSDLFVSEFLILVFLLIALCRPFSKVLKDAPAVLLFPFFAIVLSVLTILGQGLYFSIFIIFVFSVIVFFFLVGKTLGFVFGLPTHFYSIIEIAFHSFLALIGVGLLFLVFTYAPQRTFSLNGKPISQYVDIGDSKSIGEASFLSADNIEKKSISIIFLPTNEKSSQETNTISRYFLNAGYKVISLNTLNKNIPLIKNADNFFLSIKLYFSEREMFLKKFSQLNDTPIEKDELQRILNHVIEQYAKNDAVYFFSEGIYNTVLAEAMRDSLFSDTQYRGAFILSFSDFNSSSYQDAFSINFEDKLIFDSKAKSSNLFVLNQPYKYLPYFSEMRGDDILASTLLQAEIDIGREDRISIANIFEKWISIRENVYSLSDNISNVDVLYGGK